MAIFIVILRETLEAAIIIGLIFSIMGALGSTKKNTLYVWLGVFLGIILSGLFAYVIQSFFHGLSEQAEEIYAGTLTLIACLMITHFIIWTNLHFKNIGAKIKSGVNKAMKGNEMYILTFLAFVSVMREGLETAIFVSAFKMSFFDYSWIFALLGFFIAIVIAYSVFFIFKSVNLFALVKWSNILFLFLSAGLLVNAIGEFESAGLIHYLPFFDISSILGHEEGVGSFLNAVVGYNSQPSVLSFFTYFVYLFGVGFFLIIPKKWNA